MDDKILTIYCLCADVVKATGHTDAPQQRMSDAEVISTGLVAMLCFRGNFESARALLRAPRYIPHMLSRSRLNRRLHRLQELLLTLFELVGETWKHLNTESVYIIDSFPIAVCDNYRIPRAKLYKHEAHRGYIARKKRYFYGLKMHLMVTNEGQPVECFLTPGSSSDVRARSCTFSLRIIQLPENQVASLRFTDLRGGNERWYTTCCSTYSCCLAY
jgi:Transposase DDE domain